MLAIDHILNTRERLLVGKLLSSGAPGEIRTPDLQLRRLPLYPAELRARISSLHGGIFNAQTQSPNANRRDALAVA